MLAPSPTSPDPALNDDRRTRGVVAAVAGLATVLLCAHLISAGMWYALPVYVGLAVVGCALAAVDLREHRLPNKLTLGVLPWLVLGLAAASIPESRWKELAVALMCAIASGSFHLVLALLHATGLGMGDVKLSLSLGAALGWLSPMCVVTGIIAEFLIGGVVALFLLASGRASRSTPIAFGPAMLLGAWWAVVMF